MKDILTNITTPQVLILIGGILTLIGAFWSSHQDNIKEKLINEKNEIIISKTQEISDLNARTVSILTGGESFPYAILGLPDGVPILQLNGEYAIQNVEGRFLDVRALRKHQRKYGITGQFQGDYFKKNIISPAFGSTLVSKNFYIENGGRFLVHFYTPYHTFTQHIAVEKDPSSNVKLQAYRIYRDDKLIFTHYPENFPIQLDNIDFLENISDEEAKELLKKGKPKFPVK